MNPRMIKRLFLYILAALLFFSCPNPISKSDEDDEDDENYEMEDVYFESFYLAPQYNTGLDGTVIGEIKEDAILLVVPGPADNTMCIPSFDTNAQTVTVNGMDQISGESYQDFFGPIEYVLTSESGSTRSYTVEMIHIGEWYHMEGSPVGMGSLPQIGFLHDIFPELIYLDSGTGQLRSIYFNAFSSSYWVPFSGTGHFGVATVTQFSSYNADGPVWAAYINDALPDYIQLYKYDSASGWGDAAPMPLNITSPVSSMNLFMAYYDTAFLSFINGSDALQRAELWQFNGEWNQIGGGALSDYTATSLCAAVMNNEIWAAATYDEYPDSLYLYQYNYGTESWTYETVSLSSCLVSSLFEDDDTGQPILAVRCQNAEDSSQIDIHWLSWDSQNNEFSDFVPALTLSNTLSDTIKMELYNNTPLVITSDSVYEYMYDGWRELGGEPYADTPADSFSLAAGAEGYRFVSYQDSETSEIKVKMVELE